MPPPYRDPDPPKNLGFVGPYRLGMMGKKNPRWGIFANEWQRNDRREQLQDRPNRSVEVLQLKANGRRYIDPIAALSEAPRLPLPTTAQYAAAAENDDAVTVERYDATPALYAAFPGGMNTFGKTSKPRPDQNQGKDMYGKTAVDPDMIREVLNALMSTDEWKAISEAAQAMGQDQPMVEGQNELGDPGMMDPMAGGMAEPPMEEPMMDPGMDPGMVDPGMGADAMPPMEPGMEEEVVEEEVDQNVAPALAAAGRMALQQGAKAAGQTAGTMAAEKVMNRGQGQNQQQPRKQGILAKILAGPGEGNLAATPRQQFGAVPGITDMIPPARET